jgi:hypothetical protein
VVAEEQHIFYFWRNRRLENELILGSALIESATNLVCQRTEWQPGKEPRTEVLHRASVTCLSN